MAAFWSEWFLPSSFRAFCSRCTKENNSSVLDDQTKAQRLGRSSAFSSIDRLHIMIPEPLKNFVTRLLPTRSAIHEIESLM